MGRRCCCEKPGCELGSDDFNDRADGPVPANDPKWKLLDGEANFDDGTVIVDGILATRICHPSAYPLGSLWTRIWIVIEYDEGLEGFPIHKIRFGDPTEVRQREVWFIPESTGGDPTEANQMTIRVWVDGEFRDCIEEDGYEGRTQVDICYAPGLHLYAQSLAGPSTLAVEECIDDTGARCYFADETNVGNVSLIEGIFDEIEFEVHWIENPACKWCGCFCASPDSGGYKYRCFPDTLLLSLVNDEDCPLIEGDYELHVTKFDVSWGGGTEDPGTIQPYCERSRWLSDIIQCEDGKAFRLGLQCGEHTQPGIVTWTLYLFVSIDGYDQPGLHFIPDDEGVSGPYIAQPRNGASCDPIFMEFGRIGSPGFDDPAHCCTDQFLDKYSYFMAIITEPE